MNLHIKLRKKYENNVNGYFATRPDIKRENEFLLVFLL